VTARPTDWALGYREQARADLRGAEFVLGIVEDLERAHPQLVQSFAPATAAGTPKLEYPWETEAGEVHWPEAHLRVAQRLSDASSRLCADVLRFARLLEQRFDQIFRA
jgi:hypothetical protein